MSPTQRQNELTRLVTEHPGWTTAQFEFALWLPAGQVLTGLQTLEAKGVVEQHAGGWRRRVSGITSFRRGQSQERV